MRVVIGTKHVDSKNSIIAAAILIGLITVMIGGFLFMEFLVDGLIAAAIIDVIATLALSALFVYLLIRSRTKQLQAINDIIVYDDSTANLIVLTDRTYGTAPRLRHCPRQRHTKNNLRTNKTDMDRKSRRAISNSLRKNPHQIQGKRKKHNHKV